MSIPFYQNMGGLAIFTGVIFGALTLIYYLQRSLEDPDDISFLALNIKEKLYSMHLKLMIDMSEKIFSKVEKVLPDELSQYQKKDPTVSIFDRFCMNLRDLGDEDFTTRSRNYLEVVKILISNIISEKVKDMLYEGKLENKVEEDYVQMEGETSIKLGMTREIEKRISYISEIMIRTEKLEKNFLHADRWYSRFFILTIVTVILTIPTLLILRGELGHYLILSEVGLSIIFLIFSVICHSMIASSINALKDFNKNFSSPDAAEDHYQFWKVGVSG